ncbi:eukaryotic translation initiation factor 4 gamma 3-like [Hippoglossus stenolepis]|uniref:eukaryotic translation initiation factor 4 gamma 3-like n=1 Tax=Hippoglossus stenolepis TaxID=195615 RepID=UPI001FAFB805|nr:eukaryotic translation initiation factor 4 gamma 3-like [Hippoglossus stenolepis]
MVACRNESAASGIVLNVFCVSLPSIRPGSQTPAAVYLTNQPIMMTMAPMPFPSPQAAQYYILQVSPSPLYWHYHHSQPYVGPPQPYSVQPPGSGTFYTGPGPGEYPAPYHPLRYQPPVWPCGPAPVPTVGPPYYPGQTVYPPSTPIIVPTPQQPPPAMREKKTFSSICIRDPNQGGRDITEEIMAGGSGSRNSTSPVGHPSSTPTPPQFLWPHPHYPHIFYLKSQQLSSIQTPEPSQPQPQPPQPQQAHPGGYTLESLQPQQPQQPLTTGASDTKPGPDDAPKLQPVVQKSSSPGLVQPEAPVERPEANTPETEPTPPASEPELPPPASLSTPVNLPLTAANSSERPSAREESASSHLSSVGEQKPSLAPPQPPNTDKPLLDAPRTLAALSVAAPKALNGLAESGTELETAAHEPSLMPPAALQPQASSPAYREASSETLPSDMRPQVPTAAALAPMAPVAVVPVTLSSSPAPALPVMLPPGLPPLVQATTEADEPSKSIDTKDLVPGAGTEAQGGITDSKTESQHPALIRNSPTTDDAPKLQPVVQKSSSPGLVQPEAPVERPEANTPETEPTPPASERPSAGESASSHLSSVGEQKPSLAPPQPPNTDKPLLDAPRTLAALSVAAPKALNGLVESGTELETAAHEPSLMPPAALQPQASSPAYREASSETLPSDMRPQVPIAAALAPMAPVAVVPVTLSSSPAPALPVMLPPGLPPLVQATTEADEPSKSIDTKDLVPGAGTEMSVDQPAGDSDSGATPGDKENSTGAPQDRKDLANPSGPLQYDRDFLLSFQFKPACTQKPEGHPVIPGVVLDQMNQNKLPSRVVDSRVISRGPDFTPASADFGRQKKKGRGAPLKNIGAQQPRPRRIITLSMHDDVQPKKSENAWKAGMKRKSLPAELESQRTQDLFKKVRSILNKLTPDNFKQLMKQVTDWTIETEERLKGVIDLVFEKAITEPNFSVAYGNMCHCLATIKVPTTDEPNNTVNFRKLLLIRCQQEFKKDKVDDVVLERKQKELESAVSVSTERDRLQLELQEAKMIRRRSIGNIKFIGELFKLKMLTETIMHECVVKLLKNHDQESLECLCTLLTTIGKELDFEQAKPRMDQYINQMEKIIKDEKTLTRIKFMLRSIIELRLHNWVPRKPDQGPKTIDQIHQMAMIEEQEENRRVQQLLLSMNNQRGPDQTDQRVEREETWNTVPMTKIPKISKPQMDENIHLVPWAQVTWVKGSSGGAKPSELSRTMGPNRFSALQFTPSPQPSTTPQPEVPDSGPEVEDPEPMVPDLSILGGATRKKTRKGRKK